MLNPLRRIFETFQKFNGIDDLYREDIEARKLFHVNSHSIDSFDADLNDKDVGAIMNKVKGIFEELGASNHYKHYWNNEIE